MGMMAAVLSGYALALFAPSVCRYARAGAGWLLALLPLGLFLYFAGHLPAVASGNAIHVTYPWAPALGINLTFTLDGLGLLFAGLISGIGTLILIYAGGYLAGHEQLGRLYAFLLMFMASMLGVVLADNVLALFVFWELTSLSSYLLIGFDHQREKARAAALQALLVTGGGGLALLAGLLLLGQIGGSMELSVLAQHGAALRGHSLYAPCLLLILLGAFTKSAQFPFHFWLPSAMEAPTPVSAYLHSATMVKAGVYLLARLNPTLGGTYWWMALLTVFGGVTLLVGGISAIVQSDLKRALAFSTVSALGMLTLLIGMGGMLPVQAAMAYLLAHAMYKGGLFLVAGIIDHETGTRDADRLGGLWRDMPITAVAAGLAALSMAGLPPLFGFISKEFSYEAVLHDGAPWVIVAMLAGNIFLVAVAIVVGIRPFVGKLADTLPHTPSPSSPGEETRGRGHEAGPSLWLGAVVLATLSVFFGLWPTPGLAPLASAASTSVLREPADMHLALWHGFTPTLALSGLTLVLGIAAYFARSRLRHAAASLANLLRWGPAGWYEYGLHGLNALAAVQTRLLQSGYLRYYLLIVLVTAIGLVGGALASRGELLAVSWKNVEFYEAGLAALIVLAILTAVLARSRLTAIASLGVVGYGAALIFVFFGAPDVAMTQFLVETLTVILFVLVFYNVPESPFTSPLSSRLRDAIVTAIVGTLMTLLVLVAVNHQYHPTISGYYAEHSVELAHGRNIVNVILVDFRALDTLGEISVLAAAGIGVYSLVKLRRPSAMQASPLTPLPQGERGKGKAGEGKP